LSNAPYKSIPWEAIKQAYCYREDKPSYRTLEKEFGISYSYIGQRASKENWMQLREEFNQEAQSKLRDKMMKIAVNIRMKNLMIVNLTIENIYKRIEEGDYKFSIAELDKLIRLQHFLLGENESRKELNVKDMTVNVLKEVKNMTREEIKLLGGYLDGIILPGVENIIDLENSASIENIKLFNKQKDKNLTVNN